MTVGWGKVAEAERISRSDAAITSALSLRSSTHARRTEHTLSGSKVALRTSTCWATAASRVEVVPDAQDSSGSRGDPRAGSGHPAISYDRPSMPGTASPWSRHALLLVDL